MLHSLCDDFSDISQWMAVYVEEAHATDEWPISSSRFNGTRGPVSIQQAKTQSDRGQAAQAFVQDFSLKMPMWCADIAGKFEVLYAPWPVRLYVMCGTTQRILHIGQPVKCAPDLDCLRHLLLDVRKRNT